MKNFIIILLLNFNLVQGQVKLLSYGTETFNKIGINEAPYFGFPDISYIVQLSGNPNSHFKTYIQPYFMGRNGIRLFDGDDMKTYRALYSGATFGLGYYYGAKRQHYIIINGGYLYNWNLKEKFFLGGNRSEKTIVYDGSGEGRLIHSNFKLGINFSFFKIAGFSATYQFSQFLNPNFIENNTQPYSFFKTDPKIELSLNLPIAILKNKESPITEGNPNRPNKKGIFDKEISTKIDSYGTRLFTNESLKADNIKLWKAKKYLTPKEYSFFERDLNKRLKQIAKREYYIPQTSDTLKVKNELSKVKIVVSSEGSFPESFNKNSIGEIRVPILFLDSLIKFVLIRKRVDGSYFNDVKLNVGKSLKIFKMFKPKLSDREFDEVLDAGMDFLAFSTKQTFNNLHKITLNIEFEDALNFVISHELSHLLFDDFSEENSISNEIRADAIGYIIATELSKATPFKIEQSKNLNFSLNSTEDLYKMGALGTDDGSNFFFDIYNGTLESKGNITHPSFDNRKELISRNANIYFIEGY